jgi:hypothetical protein
VAVEDNFQRKLSCSNGRLLSYGDHIALMNFVYMEETNFKKNHEKNRVYIHTIMFATSHTSFFFVKKEHFTWLMKNFIVYDHVVASKFVFSAWTQKMLLLKLLCKPRMSRCIFF